MGDTFRSIVLGLGGNNGAKGAAHSRLVALVAPLRGVWAAAVKRKVPWRQHPDGEGRGGRVRWSRRRGARGRHCRQGSAPCGPSTPRRSRLACPHCPAKLRDPPSRLAWVCEPEDSRPNSDLPLSDSRALASEGPNVDSPTPRSTRRGPAAHRATVRMQCPGSTHGHRSLDASALLVTRHLDPAGLPGEVVNGMPRNSGDHAELFGQRCLARTGHAVEENPAGIAKSITRAHPLRLTTSEVDVRLWTKRTGARPQGPLTRGDEAADGE